MLVTILIVAFSIALCAIVFLFSIAYLEAARGTVVSPRIERVFDTWATGTHTGLMHIGHMVDHWPTYMMQFGYYLVHVAAVLVALVARAAERRAHAVADFVSHKRSFTRRETQSDFLRAVQEHKETLEIPDDIGKE